MNDDSDDSDDLVVVHTFNSRPEADLAKSALDAAGIESMVLGDDAGGTQPGFWESEGVKVLVNRENEAAAREVLELDARATPDQS
jgi:putative signal transducing protein